MKQKFIIMAGNLELTPSVEKKQDIVDNYSYKITIPQDTVDMIEKIKSQTIDIDHEEIK